MLVQKVFILVFAFASSNTTDFMPTGIEERVPMLDGNGDSASEGSDTGFIDDAEVLDLIRHGFPLGPHDLKLFLTWGAGLTLVSINAGLHYLGIHMDDTWICSRTTPLGVQRFGYINAQQGDSRVMRAECSLNHKPSNGKRCRCSLGFANNLESFRDREAKLTRWADCFYALSRNDP